MYPTELTSLQELLKRLQDRHVDCAEAVAKKAAADAASAATVSPDTPNVLQAMMKLDQSKGRAKTVNKVALEAEKEKDAAEKAVEELKRQLQPKRVRTDDDAGDAHDLIAEFDNCDLNDHHREGTCSKPSQPASRVSRQSTEASHRQGRFLASHASWSGWVDFILVLGGFGIARKGYQILL